MSEKIEKTNEKASFFLGLFAGISVISLVSFFILFALMWKLNNADLSTVAAADDGDSNVAADTIDLGDFPAPEQLTAPAVTAADHVWGNPDAKVTIIEYSDFECPYCGRHWPTMKQIKETYGDQIRVIFRHFPLSFHANAQPAAIASECAADQGKFWEMYNKLFEAGSAGRLGEEGLYLTFARELGLNEATFSQCIAGSSKDAKISSDMEGGSGAGVTGTPGTFVNGNFISGAYPFEYFAAIIDAELAK